MSERYIYWVEPLIDWAEPLICAQQALKAAQDEFALGRHVQARVKLWECLQAINEASDASLNISPALE